MPRYVFEEASRSDDSELNTLLREGIMPGSVSVTFRREPSFFDAVSILGDQYQCIKCVDSSEGNLVGFASRASYKGFLNGIVTRIGYLGDLRISLKHRNKSILSKGYQYLKQLHVKDPKETYLTLLLDGNRQSRTLLTSGRAGLPIYRPLGRFLTPLIRLDLPKSPIIIPGVDFERGSIEKLDEIFTFIQTCYAKHQYAPLYQASDYGTARLKDFNSEDFYLARREGELVGVIATWDQSHFRQTYIERYSLPYNIIRPVYNALCRLVPFKPLPLTGGKILYFYTSFVAIKNDDPAIFRFLLRQVYIEKRLKKYHYFICGLHEKNPLAHVLKEYRRFNAGGHLYSVHFDNQPVSTSDDRIPHIEIAAV